MQIRRSIEWKRCDAAVSIRSWAASGTRPMPPWDHGGYAELAGSLDMRIATGENEYNKHAFMDLLLKKGADVVQPDNRRAGGPHRVDGDWGHRRRLWR